MEGVDGLLCDLDGVVYRGERAVDGAAEALSRARAGGIRLLFCTNNSRYTLAQYVRRLAAVGVDAAPEEILTSGIVTAEVLGARGFAGRRALVVGGAGVENALIDNGIAVTRSEEDPDVVVVGWDPDFTYEAMARAARAVMGGAEFVATNDDASFPAPDGLLPGAGAILASIETASGRRAEVMGKPNAPMMKAAAERLRDCDRIAVVGDRADTDLAGATSRGWISVLVLSGVTRADQVATVEPRPDLVVGSLAELFV